MLGEMSSTELSGWYAYHHIKNEEQTKRELEMKAQRNMQARKKG